MYFCVILVKALFIKFVAAVAVVVDVIADVVVVVIVAVDVVVNVGVVVVVVAVVNEGILRSQPNRTQLRRPVCQ